MLLLIDTANEKASVCLVKDDGIIAEKQNESQMNHAAFLQPAIKELCYQQSVELKDLSAISVMAGPGSYTGLRVGMASAKGLCYALNIPLICINTLEVMAKAVVNEVADLQGTLICPMIDARRMEVFTAVYDRLLKPIVAPCAMILDIESFIDLRRTNKLIITGNGANKFTTMLQHQNISTVIPVALSVAFAQLSLIAFSSKAFASLPYSEPVYLKGIFIQGK